MFTLSPYLAFNMQLKHVTDGPLNLDMSDYLIEQNIAAPKLLKFL